MSNIMNTANKVVKTLGLLGIMLSLAGAFAVAPSASASTLDNSAGTSTLAAFQTPAPTGKLGVYAINTLTGATVAGAEVVVVDLTTGQSIVKGLTRTDGSFSAELPEGGYKVGIFAKGFKQHSEYVKVSAGKATITKIGIEPINKVEWANPPAALW
jgi:hypothetical protein